MNYRTPAVPPGHNLTTYRVGDKVKVFTKPWSPDYIYGQGHHDLFNNQIGTITDIFPDHWYPDPTTSHNGILYWVRFSHCTYICAIGDMAFQLIERSKQ